MPRVMISYRNVDGQKQFASSLERDLRNAGFETWLDINNIPRGSKWEDEIFKGIINSDYVILCLSPEYFDSETCLVECYVARGYGKTIFPIIVPHNTNEEILDFIPRFEATRGIDQINLLNFHSQSVLSLAEDRTKLTRRLIKAITNPTLPDIDYAVYLSFKSTQATFATNIADDLNKAGIKAFIHTRSLDPGVDWRQVSWSAGLRAKIHIVILSPDVEKSEFIKKEVLVTRTKKEAQFIPILAQEFADDEGAQSTIRQTFKASKDLASLNEIQWFIQRGTYEDFIADLIFFIEQILG